MRSAAAAAAGMNADGINMILRRVCGDAFCRVYPWNQLPNPKSRLCLFVVNTDCHHLPGTHWIAIRLEKDGEGEYFDPLGRQPAGQLAAYMKKNCAHWTFNEKQLQSLSSRFCGHYCVFYCAYSSLGFSMQHITSMFTNDTGMNDVLVHHFVCQRRKNSS